MFLGRAHGSYIGDIYADPTPNTSGRAVLGSIPSGVDGMRETLRIMRQRVRESVRSPDQIIRRKALELVQDLPPRKYFAEIKAIQGFVRDQIRYVRDPVSVELIQTPEYTLQIAQGDCDDKSTLLAALLDAIGHPVRFVAVAFQGNQFSHVLVETKVNGTGDDKKDWMPLETILPKEPGWFPDGVTAAYRLKV